jgi:hypothetical protein
MFQNRSVQNRFRFLAACSSQSWKHPIVGCPQNAKEKEPIMFSKQVKEKYAALMFKLGVAFLVIVFVVVLGPGMLKLESSQALAKKKKGGQYCTQTANVTYKACLNENADDYNIAYGKCINVSDADERATCFNDAKQEYKDAKGDCKDQLDARRDVCDALGEDRYDPDLTGTFSATIDNSYFPLNTGDIYTYYSYDTPPEEPPGSVLQTVVDTVGDPTIIDGFDCRQVTDKVYDGQGTGGNLLEDTIDWYSQDGAGSVWYFGESTIAYTYDEFGNPTPDNEGSWKTGDDGAKPGIIMLAAPVDQFYRQEFDSGTAEDLGKVIGVLTKAQFQAQVLGGRPVPAVFGDGPFLHTQDSTPMEPDVIEDKYYAFGVGLVLTAEPEGTEILDSITH